MVPKDLLDRRLANYLTQPIFGEPTPEEEPGKGVGGYVPTEIPKSLGEQFGGEKSILPMPRIPQPKEFPYEEWRKGFGLPPKEIMEEDEEEKKREELERIKSILERQYSR